MAAESKTELSQAQQLFSQWRENRKSRAELVPEDLFLAAARAANESGHSKAMRELNVSGNFITKAKKMLKQEERRLKPKFSGSQFKVTKVVPLGLVTEVQVAAEIEFSRGAKIRIYEKGSGLINVLRALASELAASPSC